MTRHETDTIPIVAIASNEKDLAGESSLFERYRSISTALADRGIRSVALYGKNDHLGDHVFSRYFTFTPEGLVAQEQQISVDAARDLTGGIARYTDVAALNPKGMRDLTSSKKDQYDVLRAAGSDLLPDSYFVDPDDDVAIAEALAAINGPRAVLKPEKSQRSHNVMVGTKKELSDRLVEYRAHRKKGDGLLVVQEYIDSMKSPFDDALRYEAGEKAKILPDQVRELRVHVVDQEPVFFHGTVSLPGREDQAGENDFVYFDQQYWPGDLREKAAETAQALREHTGDQDSYVVVDFSPDGSKLGEVNGKNPYAIRADSEAGMNTHRLWVHALSEKLAGMATREFTAYRGRK